MSKINKVLILLEVLLLINLAILSKHNSMEICLRRAREPEITQELVRELFQEIPSASKERVKEIAYRYLPSLAKLNFAQDRDLPTERGGNEFRDLVLTLIDEIAKRLDLENPGKSKTLWELLGYTDLTPHSISADSLLSSLSPGRILTRINGQFILVTDVTLVYVGFPALIYQGIDVEGKSVKFFQPAWWLSVVPPEASDKCKGCRPFLSWDGYVWPKELLNWK